MIAVIMSTYNGEKYLPQQLDSVLRQTLEDFILIIRDDGSSDGTVPLLRGYTDERIVLLEGKNVGPCRSFALLLQEAARRGAQQVYFCDQDDVWLPDKLARMEPLLRETDVPKLVCRLGGASHPAGRGLFPEAAGAALCLRLCLRQQPPAAGAVA